MSATEKGSLNAFGVEEIMTENNFAHFAPLHGERPFVMLDSHPNGRYVALQVVTYLETTCNRAAVWDRDTGKLEWAPEGVSALAWMPSGEHVAFIHEKYEHAPDHPAIIVTPLQSEFTYTLVLATWPEPRSIASCSVDFPMGWPTDLVVSPRGDLAVVEWNDQGESGLEFVAITADGPQQIAHPGLPHIAPLVNGGGIDGGGFLLTTNLTARPGFSPDGRYIVLAWQNEWVWWSQRYYDVDADGNEIAPASPGGEYTIGTVSIIDWQERTHRMVPIVEAIPIGWRPDPRSDGGEGLITDPPDFLDSEHFTLALPTGVVRRFSVND